MNDKQLEDIVEENGAADGVDLAQKIREEEELGLRRPQGWISYVVPAICIVWSSFQLSLASWLTLDSTIIRSIHLAFAFLVVFLSFPMFKRDIKTPGLRWLSEKRTIPIADFILAAVACLTALYISIEYDGLAQRVGQPNTQDMIVGGLLVVFLLEAARRIIGPALPIIALFFMFSSAYESFKKIFPSSLKPTFP